MQRIPALDQMRRHFQVCRRSFKALLGKDIRLQIEHECATEHFGSRYGGWTICADLLDQDSIVYSFGVGEDISFDLGLIAQFDLVVFAFDPTPRSIQWVETQNVPDSFRLQRYGIAPEDGSIRLHAPRDPRFVSHSVIPSHRGSVATIEAPVQRLTTILDTLGHRRIDLLKMDIEGMEYKVLDDLLSTSVLPKQLLIEFHHRFPGVGPSRTESALRQLHEAGYRIFAYSPSGEEISLIRTGEEAKALASSSAGSRASNEARPAGETTKSTIG